MHCRPLVLALALTACAGASRSPPPLPPMPWAVDSVRSQLLRPGVVRRFVYSPSGPWAMHVLDVDLTRCLTPVAVKGAPGAVGRRTTSALLRELANSQTVVGGVNADFFLFAPPGVPTGAMIAGARVITGPGVQPVFAWSNDGKPIIATLSAEGTASSGAHRFTLSAWNRDAPRGLSYFDSSWNTATDTASSIVEVVVDRGRVVAVDTATTGVTIPPRGFVLRTGRNPADPLLSALRALRPGDSVRAEVALSPLHPREAVGGRPVLLRDSLIVPEVDTQGGAAFATTRHPRTAVGIARSSTRLLLVVVDGRQPPYSAGMTLRELADLMRALGARDALNLDGGGSTTMVYADPDSSGALRVANRPSDPTGERPVGNALALVANCSAAPHGAP